VLVVGEFTNVLRRIVSSNLENGVYTDFHDSKHCTTFSDTVVLTV